MANMNPARFLRQVRQETQKVTWPNRQETVMTTIIVLIMAVMFALFFVLIDQVFSHVIPFILGFGS